LEINYWGTIVGITAAGPSFSDEYDGFRTWKNGAVTTIHYPGAMQTNPAAISDTGVIVGWYVPGSSIHRLSPITGSCWRTAFIKTVNYPKAFRTVLNDINASGVIVGTTTSGGGFIYNNGTFKFCQRAK
jgi:hypothetical protein